MGGDVRKLCFYCDNEFSTEYGPQKFCSDICREKQRVNDLNEKWINRGEPKKKQHPWNFKWKKD